MHKQLVHLKSGIEKLREIYRKRGFLFSLQVIINNGIGYILAFPAYILLCLLKPFLRIRMGILSGSRIGHFAANTELFLCRKDLNIEPRNTFDIFIVNHICNRQLLLMWRRLLRIYRCSGILLNTIKKMPGGDYFAIDLGQGRDIKGVMERTDRHLYFTKIETNRGYAILKEMGIENLPFVCLLTRDSAYLRQAYPHLEWDYHNHRNCDIRSYGPAVEALIHQGYFVVRMGVVNEASLKIDDPHYIEYAERGFRSDFMDLFLCERCRFFISCGSGLDSVANIFRTPVLYVNYTPVEHVHAWSSSTITIFKKYKALSDNRFLSFQEVLESGIGRFIHSDQFSKNGIAVVDNSEEEIKDACVEMHQRLSGTWIETEEEEQLQEKFWMLFEPNDLNQVFNSRIGTQFLRKNKYLLADR